jgi:hypothetical protein
MSENCNKLHKLFNSLERHKFPFDKNKIPKNGIYILFENKEKVYNLDRIVRIGTHTGLNQLHSRLEQHFLKENKDRSIFRKNIGRALLNKAKDPFIDSWELDLTTKENKEKYSLTIDFNRQKEIEKKVTEYIQKNFSFVVFEVSDKERRLSLESKIISTVSLCKECIPSKEWLGLYSPKIKIRESGLWLVNELYKTPFNTDELNQLLVEIR